MKCRCTLSPLALGILPALLMGCMPPPGPPAAVSNSSTELRATASSSPTESPASVPSANLATQDNGSPFDGKTLGQWRVIDKDSYQDHGPVSVVDGAIVLKKGNGGTGVVWSGKTPAMNYEVALEARRDDGDDFFCGLTFPVDESHCTLILGGWGGGTTGLSNVDGYAAVENETSGFVEFKNGQWYKVRLRVTDKNISAWVDEQKIVDLDTEGRKFSVWWEQEPARPLGIGTWYTSASLRNLRLTPVEAGK